MILRDSSFDTSYKYVCVCVYTCQRQQWSALPSLVFGVLALFSALLCFVLPETRDRPMLDTVEQLTQYVTVVTDFTFSFSAAILSSRLSFSIVLEFVIRDDF